MHRFLHSWQDTELIPRTPSHRLLEDEIFGHHMLQTRHSSDQKFTHQMPTLFSKEHVISGSHPDNLVCG